DGAILGEINGLTCKRASRSAILRAAQTSLDDWLHELVWRPLGAPTASGQPRRWLVLSDYGGVGASLIVRLRGSGHTCRESIEVGEPVDEIVDLRALDARSHDGES